MKLPYHLITVRGNSIVAARGASLETFDIKTGKHLASWNHPAELRQREGGRLDSSLDVLAGNQRSSTINDSAGTDPGPPTKRRRLSASDGSDGEGAGDLNLKNVQAEFKGSPDIEQKKKENGKSNKRQHQVRSEERPVITALTSTPDGHHLVTVTGVDKTIRVFSHDENGAIQLLSERSMPKRPSAIALTADGKTILSADKFGDVYALPLDQSSETSWQKDLAPPQSAAPARLSRPEADERTVHTQKNLRALENQLKIAQQQSEKQQQQQQQQQAQHTHTPILGHVSLLTAITVSQDESGRPYILTADRDEHIRVSRGLPTQAHIIEAYCLGHAHFVSRLCVLPPPRADVLVSGGGDDELFLWRWRTGTLLSKVNLLARVREVAPDVTKIAAAGLHACSLRVGGREICSVLVFCERVPALFVFHLSTNATLEYSTTMTLPGNPLDLAVVECAGVDSLIIAVDQTTPTTNKEGESDPGPRGSLVMLEADLTDGQWRQSSFQLEAPDINGQDSGLAREEIEASLYTLEGLRKAATHGETGEHEE